jgi:rare lipoprotein A
MASCKTISHKNRRRTTIYCRFLVLLLRPTIMITMRNIYTMLAVLSCLCYLSPTNGQNYYGQRNTAASQQAETGQAVYYADYLAGRTTAMGEIYRPEEYTAAHKTYPFGTLLRVTRLDNGKSVVVRVNDRGPYDSGVVVDLSKAAAMDIGLLRDGRAQVKVETVGTSSTNPRRGQLAGQNRQSQPQSYSNNAYADTYSNARSQSYPSAASRASYSSRSTESNSSNSSYFQPNAYNTPSSYSNTPTQNERRDQWTARGTTDYNTPSSYSDNSYSRPQSYNTYRPAGETSLTMQSRGATNSSNTNSSYALPRGTQGYAIQLASYKNADNAQRQIKQLEDRGLNSLYIWQKDGFDKVIIAIFPTQMGAQQYLENIRQSHQVDGLIVKVR